jgi:tetratricopeptide (TPR) repeat protein
MPRSQPSGKPGRSRSSKKSEPQGIPVETGIELAYRHWEAGQLQEAEMLCRQVLAVWPGQVDVHHLLGLMAHALGRIDMAVDHLRQACAQPTAPAAYFSNFGELCRRAGRVEEAEHAARQAAARDWTAPGIWSNLGIILQEAGKLEDSLRCLKRVLVLAPDSPEGHNNLANTLILLNRREEAAVRYGTALNLNPLYADACSNLGKLMGELGHPDQGIGLLRRAIEIDPRMVDAYFNCADLEAGRGRWAEALDWLEALRDFAPDHPGLARAFAFIRLRQAEDETEQPPEASGDPVENGPR